VEVVICPPFTSLKAAVERCAQSRVRVAAQNMHEEQEGAFTGEVSAPMLLELGVDGVILGHSERRQYFNETDEPLARKVPAALAARLEPILCVGELESERDAGETEAVLQSQLTADLAEVADDGLAEVVIAYEPVWAIGTGKTATPEQAQEAMAFIRGLIESRSAEAAEAIRILYGGSVKPDNAAELLAQDDIDGALVGGASLDPGDFAAIVEAAAG
jgi:triosephosphate isomerase